MIISQAELNLVEWIDKQTPEVVNSAYLKLELGIATPEEQMMMATMIQHIREVMRGN